MVDNTKKNPTLREDLKSLPEEYRFAHNVAPVIGKFYRSSSDNDLVYQIEYIVNNGSRIIARPYSLSKGHERVDVPITREVKSCYEDERFVGTLPKIEHLSREQLRRLARKTHRPNPKDPDLFFGDARGSAAFSGAACSGSWE